MAASTRAGFLALAAGGALAVVDGSAFAATVASSDADILKLAATAELLAIDFYDRAIHSTRFRGDDLRYLAEAQLNEKGHYAALAKALGPAAPKGLRFRYPQGSFRTEQSAAQVGVTLETAFVGAYLGAVSALRSDALRSLAAQIAAVEAEHLSVFGRIFAKAPVGPDFPQVLGPRQAKAALAPFLA